MQKIAFAVSLVVLILVPGILRADRLDDLRDKIEERRGQIQDLEKDIKEYQEQLQEVGEEKQTLQAEIDRLNISKRKVETDIAVTERQIDTTELTIEELTLEIAEKEEGIELNTDTIGATIRRMHEVESQTLVETVLGYDRLSDALGEIDTLQQFQVSLTADLQELHDLKQELEAKREDLLVKQAQLSNLRGDLAGQREVIVVNQAEKDQLLDITENKEASYQALLQEKLRQREQFARELREIESQLTIDVDSGAIPPTGSGILAWPLDAVRVTQHFGNTPFATQNPQVYKGAGHNGIDLGTPRGTRVKATLSGTVVGTGNTDAVPGCYSYGKWILVRHSNGLASLYAHLDVINVREGQSVATGETIGFSGNTGFSTGPHLHFTVYAAQGVKVQQFSNSINCKDAIVPVAPQEAYLNPLSYLSAL